MIRRFAAIAAVLAACGEPPAVEAQANDRAASLFAAAPSAQWRLSAELREISGLAVASDRRVFAHDDERAVIYEIVNGAAVKAFVLGDPVVTGDFEGLAIVGDVFWMTTSQGLLYRFVEGEDGARVAFETFDSGLRDVCEIEGLAYVPAEDGLILGCKQNHARAMRDTVSLHIWRFAGAAEPWRTMPGATLARAAGVRRFSPSSLEHDPVSGRLLLLSARDGALAELGADGVVLAARALGRGHVQAEGVAVAPDGALLIADEGAGGRALLSRYDRVP